MNKQRPDGRRLQNGAANDYMLNIDLVLLQKNFFNFYTKIFFIKNFFTIFYKKIFKKILILKMFALKLIILKQIRYKSINYFWTKESHGKHKITNLLPHPYSYIILSCHVYNLQFI